MKKVLILKGDDISINVMRRILKSDFEIDFCKSGEEYYKKYSKTNYDIIIIDISLKETKSGMELINEIKKTPSCTGTPILCLTAPVSNKVLRETVAFIINKN